MRTVIFSSSTQPLRWIPASLGTKPTPYCPCGHTFWEHTAETGFCSTCWVTQQDSECGRA